MGLGKCMCGCTGVCTGELVFSVYMYERVILCLGKCLCGCTGVCAGELFSLCMCASV